MGVIDLDKRVKKLEQEGTGGGVIDQLEAAVTALESDVEDLQEAADYSTTECIVGKWIDNRPIYKKTFDAGDNTQISYTTWTTLSAVTIENFAGLIKVEGATETLGTCGPFLATTTGSGTEKTLQLQTPRNANEAAVRYVTVWYLKTNPTT